MLKNFWQKLKKPIFILAPMANVTDSAFRQIIAKYGKPDVMWTEFVSCDGLCSSGKKILLCDLKFSETERPIVAQFFGSKPENFYKCAKLAQKFGFDGIDINMGCPDKSVERQGAGAALIKNPALAKKIIFETKRGAGSLPVSVKTRIGYNEIETDDWLKSILETQPAAITVHARTRKEMSKVPARWEEVQIAVKLRNQFDQKRKILIFGNGDVKNLKEAKERIRETGADGVMIGRGIFGNPWFFADLQKKNKKRIEHPDLSRIASRELVEGNKKIKPEKITLEKRLAALLEHTRLFEKMYKKTKKFDLMKKHFKAYITGFDGAKEIRTELMKTKNASEVEKVIIKNFSTLTR